MGIVDVSRRALAAALQGDRDMTAAEMAWLDDGQLGRMIAAAGMMRDAAQAELDGRGAPPAGKASTGGLVCDPMDGRLVCPDGGSCGHGCGTGLCWRVDNAEPLTAAGWGDDWPAEVVRAEHARGPAKGHL